MPTKVLVTGGAGYLGSVLCEELLKAGYEVTVLDSLLYQQSSLFSHCASPKFHFVRGDVRDKRLLQELLPKQDVLIPLAAIVGAVACDRDPWAARSVNFEAIEHIHALRSESQLVIFPVTNSGYGTKSGEIKCTEESLLEPISLYGRTKVEAEALLLTKKNTISLRLATVFGMSFRMRIDLLVNHFVYCAVNDGYLVIFEKDFKRNFVHVRDVADCFLHAIIHSKEMVDRPYNVGLESANLSKEELALKIQQRIPSFYIHFSELGSDPDKRNYLVSNERLKSVGFEAKRSLEMGIEELIQGYKMMPRSTMKNV